MKNFIRTKSQWKAIILFSFVVNMGYSILWSYIFLSIYLYDCVLVLRESILVILIIEVVLFPVLTVVFAILSLYWITRTTL